MQMENHSPIENEIRQESLTSRPWSSLSDRFIIQEQGFENASTVCLRGSGSLSLQPFWSREHAPIPIVMISFFFLCMIIIKIDKTLD